MLNVDSGGLADTTRNSGTCGLGWKLFMAALSTAEPTWPIDPTMAWRVNARCSFEPDNRDSRSEWTMQPAIALPSMRRCSTAGSSAETARRDFILESMEQPAIRLDYASLITQR